MLNPEVMEERAAGTQWTPLPQQIRKFREKSFSICISNLSQQISKNELEAMLWRAGRIVDVFIHIDKRSNSRRGFAFVRFQTLKEAEKAIEPAEGRFWGGREIQETLLSKAIADMKERIWRKEPCLHLSGWKKSLLQCAFQRG